MNDLRDPFNPKTGEFRNNIRVANPDDSELRESLKRFGWYKQFPAIADENGVILVGHRRMKIAKDLGIEPVVQAFTFGKGDAADAERLKIALASNIGGAPMTKEDRKHIAEYLYGSREWTMDRIAEALDVSTQTISTDLGNFQATGKLKPAKTATNPKGAGRPKGSKGTTKPPRGEAAKYSKARELVRPGVEAEQPLKLNELELEHGISRDTFERAALAEQARKEALANPTITPDMLSMTAQQKLHAAIRQAKRKLEIEIETRCREDLQRWLNEVTLPQYAKELGALERSIRERKGIMDRITYKKILACLHPDRVTDPALKKRYEEAFRLFTELEKRVLDEKESPTQFRNMPRTYEELMAMKAKVQAERRAKRSGKPNVSVRR